MPPVDPSGGTVNPFDYTASISAATQNTGTMPTLFKILVFTSAGLFAILLLLVFVCCCFGTLTINCACCCGVTCNCIRIIRKPFHDPKGASKADAGKTSTRAADDSAAKGGAGTGTAAAAGEAAVGDELDDMDGEGEDDFIPPPKPKSHKSKPPKSAKGGTGKGKSGKSHKKAALIKKK